MNVLQVLLLKTFSAKSRFTFKKSPKRDHTSVDVISNPPRRDKVIRGGEGGDI